MDDWKEFQLNKLMSPQELATALGLVEGESPQGLLTYLHQEGLSQPVAFTSGDDMLTLISDGGQVERLTPLALKIGTPVDA